MDDEADGDEGQQWNFDGWTNEWRKDGWSGGGVDYPPDPNWKGDGDSDKAEVEDNPGVLCGGHRADTCADCPQGHGAGWCNGDCMWVGGSDGECVLTAVDCGNGIRASLCAECGGAGTDKASCGGQCAWMSRSGVCRDAFSNKVRTSSVHLRYQTPTKPLIAKPLWWFQRVVVRDSADVSYFASSEHAFGYGGVQQVTTAPQPFAGRAIFSIWDQARQHFAEHFFQIERAALHSYGPDPHCC